MASASPEMWRVRRDMHEPNTLPPPHPTPGSQVENGRRNPWPGQRAAPHAPRSVGGGVSSVPALPEMPSRRPNRGLGYLPTGHVLELARRR